LQGNDDILPLPLQKMITKTISLFYLINVLRIVQDRLDTLPASLAALPDIAARMDGRGVILLDGGICRGTDIIKALSLGADAVLIGRAWVYALAAAGALGVAHVLRLLRDELEAGMALTGCAHLSDLGRHLIFHAQDHLGQTLGAPARDSR
jgi:isopentenyl diphosphate isomerase/L-lactate dehydrogenase-like FMN-dependent dehydrogenase